MQVSANHAKRTMRQKDESEFAQCLINAETGQVGSRSSIWLPQTIFVQALQADWDGDYTFAVFRLTLEEFLNLSWSHAGFHESFFNLPSVRGGE